MTTAGRFLAECLVALMIVAALYLATITLAATADAADPVRPAPTVGAIPTPTPRPTPVVVGVPPATPRPTLPPTDT